MERLALQVARNVSKQEQFWHLATMSSLQSEVPRILRRPRLEFRITRGTFSKILLRTDLIQSLDKLSNGHDRLVASDLPEA